MFSFKGAAKSLFYVKINSFINIFDLNRKFYLVSNENKKNHGFVDSKFVKTCHEPVNKQIFIYRSFDIKL